MRRPRIVSEMDNFVPAKKHESTDLDSVTSVPDPTHKKAVSSDKQKASSPLQHTGEGIDEFIALKKEYCNGETDQDITDINITKRSKQRRIVTNALTLFAILCFALGIYFVALPSIVHKNQDDAARKLLEELKKNQDGAEITVRAGDVNAPGSFSPGQDILVRPGEIPDPNRPTTTEEPIDRDAVITIKTDTIMRIPKIDLEIAVAPNVKSSSLWVLPGHYPASAHPGKKGVAAYFGHRMYGRGRHFNRLNEVEKGDTIEIQRKGKIYTYTVDAQHIIEPIDLGTYVFEETSKAKIVLVTCHPIQTTGVPEYRIVVQGHLTNTRDAE